MRRCGGLYIPLAPPVMQHSFGRRPPLCRTTYTRRTNIRKPPALANNRPSAATENCLAWDSPFPASAVAKGITH